MKNICVLFLFISAILSAQIPAKVIGIKDGDTVLVLLEGNIQKTLRLAEVDCPENGQPFGKNAKQFTSSQIFGKNIVFYPTTTDRYNRTIAKIYYGENKYLSEEIIRAGFGWWYFQFSKNENLGKLEMLARQKKLGLWQDKNAVSPWDYRKMKRKKKAA